GMLPISGYIIARKGLAGRWMGQVLNLQGRSSDTASQAWLSAEGLGLSLNLDAAGRLQSARCNRA
ncbi:MAG: hypothetical protein U5L74_11445, partial [Ideonella sp.]|nr:hypothetical protein [Ideonella sp.]